MAPFARFDPARILRASKIRVGKDFTVRGVPAILLGVTSIVAVIGISRAVVATAPSLPDALREATKLVGALRGERGDQRQLNG
ncbi:MAG TPA: hypothetical protein VHS78_00330 [Candidatus Elarobacter sp.]|jgi:hypothetical protein|nr:hypothetical protein [Candidatus Elarobacter sp.]